MALWVNLTMMILFMNIGLTLMVPGVILGENSLMGGSSFYNEEDGEFVVTGTAFEDRMDSTRDQTAGEDSPIDTGATVFSGLFLVTDFLGLLFSVAFAPIEALAILPPTVGLVVAIPIFVAYGLGLVSFIRGV